MAVYCSVVEESSPADQCVCPEHMQTFLQRPDVARALTAAKARTVCEGLGDDDDGCTVTENLRPFIPGATDDNGNEVIWALCPDCTFNL